MNLHTLLLTKNACYKSGKPMKVRGIMVHSTGANNPNLKRYVGPDDGLLGVNSANNHWNTLYPGGREVCVHAFIGKLKDGSIATYQTLPWEMIGWHSGKGSLGSVNSANYNGYIGFEICEDDLSSKEYFDKVYQEAVELSIYLCKRYGLDQTNILCHSEGSQKGIASNHADVMHWFPRHGKSMDTFREAVRVGLLPAAPAPAPQLEVNPLAGTVKVIYAGADGVNARTAPNFDNSSIDHAVHENEVFTVTGITEDKNFYRLKSGLYITTGTQYMKYSAPTAPIIPPKEVKVGSRVKITGEKYATGQDIPDWVKSRVHTVLQIKLDRALLREVMSWVYLKDLKVV